ncbi:hypothetical protein ACFUGD_24095 [Streptomyces sp. NPDC057217]|uniref:hypothetical protein n=1 Tax=Streptomyces sp. NPDC057217 TaxID=3346054 RepID=UPI00363B635C
MTGLTVGDRDPEPAKLLDRGLDAYNFAATGTGPEDVRFHKDLTGNPAPEERENPRRN